MYSGYMVSFPPCVAANGRLCTCANSVCLVPSGKNGTQPSGFPASSSTDSNGLLSGSVNPCSESDHVCVRTNGSSRKIGSSMLQNIVRYVPCRNQCSVITPYGLV